MGRLPVARRGTAEVNSVEKKVAVDGKTAIVARFPELIGINQDLLAKQGQQFLI
jgi:hypothetical protein